MNNSQNTQETFEINSFVDWLMTLTPLEFTTLGIITGYILSQRLTINQQNSLGNWFELLGQILLTFNAQGTANQCNISCQQYNELERKINLLMNHFHLH